MRRLSPVSQLLIKSVSDGHFKDGGAVSKTKTNFRLHLFVCFSNHYNLGHFQLSA